jgi:hypothetical protein
MKSVKFTAKPLKKIDNGKGVWNSLEVQIYMNGHPFGKTYVRDYPNFYRTFCHLKKHGRHFALYSPSYTFTRVMELFPDKNSWKDIGGESDMKNHFCPVDYHVPILKDLEFRNEYDPAKLPIDVKVTKNSHKEFYNLTFEPEFGFVSGCVWGDDSSWQIEYLDLTKIESGVISREARFGYISLPRGITLKKAINTEFTAETGNVQIAISKDFKLTPTPREINRPLAVSVESKSKRKQRV